MAIGITNRKSITIPCAEIHPFYIQHSFTPRTTPLPVHTSSSLISNDSQKPYAAPTYPAHPYSTPTSLCPTIAPYLDAQPAGATIPLSAMFTPASTTHQTTRSATRQDPMTRRPREQQTGSAP